MAAFAKEGETAHCPRCGAFLTEWGECRKCRFVADADTQVEGDGLSRVYAIPDGNLEKLQGMVERLNKRADKLGLDPIALTVLGVRDEQDDKGGLHRSYQVQLTGEAPRLNGWGFVAKLEHGEEGNIIRSMPGTEVEVPKEYRTAGPLCDHCGLKRDRKATYLVRHDDGTMKQVGSSCLADFMGHPDPHAVAEFYEAVADVAAAANEAERAPDDEPRAAFAFGTERYLAYVVANIREAGWTSRGRARETLELATADAAMTDMTSRDYEVPSPEPGDTEEAKAALEWARTELAGRENLSDYEHNLMVATAYDSVPPENAGLVASLIVTYRRAKDRARVAKRSNHVGAPGKRQVFSGLTVTHASSFDTRYGVSHRYSFVDGEGNVLTWVTSKRLEIGETYEGKATVKDHDEWRGINQTVITRCSFKEMEEVGG